MRTLKYFQKNFDLIFLSIKTLKNGPQNLLIIGPDPFISQSSPDHSPQPRIDFSYYDTWLHFFFSKHFFDLGFDDEAPPPPGQEKTKKKRKSKPNQKIRKRMKLLKEEQRMAEEMDAEWFSINLNTLILNFKVHIFWEGHKILRNLHLTFDLCSASQN